MDTVLPKLNNALSKLDNVFLVIEQKHETPRVTVVLRKFQYHNYLMHSIDKFLHNEISPPPFSQHAPCMTTS